ncbi:MAG: PGPGW domain-containing protein [Candidatus Gracilibacteria bacterium]|nr:PGPGW domain-containing protein [Candidatus Gracilibacteria bacterium]
MKKHLKKILRNLAGGFLLILGIIGLFLPFLQGFLFIFIAISLLDFKRKQAWIKKFKNWKPIRPLARWYDKEKAKVKTKSKAVYQKEKAKVQSKLHKYKKS